MDAMEVEGRPSEVKPRSCCHKVCLGCGCFWILMVLNFVALYFWTFPSTNFTNTEFTGADGTKLHAYLATPTVEPDGPEAPAAIVFHAWNGMSEETTYFADRLAAMGYYAIAPDLFRGVASHSWNLVRNIVNVVMAPQDRLDADADAALQYLLSMGKVNESLVVSGPGFCFGGAQSLLYATRHPTTLAIVTLYGTYIAELGDPQSSGWGLIGTMPVLGIYGELDSAPGPEDALAFEAALRERGNPHEVKIWPGVGHAFVTPEAHREEEHPNHAQATGAWAQVEDFMASVRSNATALIAERGMRTATTQLHSADAALSHGIHAGHGIHAAHNLRSEKEVDVLFHHKVLCALKCAFGMLTGHGHLPHGGLSSFFSNWW